MYARYTYRLRLSKTVARELEAEWDRCRWVWNQSVAESKRSFETGETCGPVRLSRELTKWRSEHKWLAQGSSVTQQRVIRDDFGPARQKALMDIKNRVPMQKRKGLPRFKKRNLVRPSLNYVKTGFSLRDGRLVLAGGLSCVVIWSRELPSEPTSVRVSRDSEGHWNASFVVETQIEELPVEARAPLGIDWGVTKTATTTDPQFDLPHSQHGKKSQTKLTKYQRQMARRKPQPGKPASAGYRKARVGAAKIHAKTARRRQDDRRKWAKSVVRAHHEIAVEDFQPKFLAKSTMAKKSADAAIAAAKAELIWQAQKHGRDLRLVNPAFSTMDCSECGARTKHRLPLGERTYNCESCGMSKPRDRNSAEVIRDRAGFAPC